MTGAVDLWTVSLAEPAPELLSPDESARAARFRFEADRVRWTRARSSLRRILAQYVEGVVQFTYGENGKPALAAGSVEFNLSHSGDFALIAVSTSAPVGVDIERIRPDVDIAALLRRLGETGLPANQAELFSRWTRREARAKAIGGQLFVPPPAHVIAIDTPAPPGYCASVALVGREPSVTLHSPGR